MTTPPIRSKMDVLIEVVEALRIQQEATNAKLENLLVQIRNALIAQDGDPTDLRSAIWGLAGPAPGRTLTDLYNVLFDGLYVYRSSGLPREPYLSNIRSALNPGNETLYALLDKLNAAVGAVPYDSTESASLRGLVVSLIEAIGFPGQPNTSSVLGRLIQIASNTRCACSALNPDLPEAGSCTGSSYHSAGFVVSDYGSQGTMVLAYWRPIPNSLSSTNGGTTLSTNTSSWSGWSVYVTSTARYFGYKSGVNNRLPTNQWIDLAAYADELTFAVEPGNSLTVTLCGPADIFGECITLQSQTMRSLGYTFAGIEWPATWPAVYDFGEFQDSSHRWVLVGNYQGWTYQPVDGVLYVRDAANGSFITTTTLGNGYRQIAVSTRSITFARQDRNTTPFELTFCPPGRFIH